MRGSRVALKREGATRLDSSTTKGGFIGLVLVLYCVSGFAGPVFGATPESASIELVTVGPGDNIYSAFGHTALLLRTEPTQPLEQGRIFNFGVTERMSPDLLIAESSRAECCSK